MKHVFSVKVGPRSFRVGAAWRAPVAALKALYAGYPQSPDGIADYTVRLEPGGFGRRWIRPSVRIDGDFMLPDAVPLPLDQALLAAEMGMNLQVALGERRFMLLHASTVERGGKCVIMTGESGSGKSTLSAALGERGWRFMGDEFALIDPATGLAHPFPRPVSLKNESIAAMADLAEDRFGPLLPGTPKGDIRHLRPNADALARMDEPAKPVVILFPAFGFGQATRPVGQGEVFVRLTQASTNYTHLGEAGFAALTGLVSSLPAYAIDYGSTEQGVAAVEALA
jgi:HprK-related kinase A